MKITTVTYTTKPGYSEQNIANVKNVIEELGRLQHPGIFYHICMHSNGKTFVHTAFFNSEEDQKLLTSLESFNTFRQQLLSSDPEIQPHQELLTLVASSNNFFTS